MSRPPFAGIHAATDNGSVRQSWYPSRDAVHDMAAKVRHRIEQFRSLAMKEARQEAERELATTFEMVEEVWNTVISAKFSGLIARLSPQDRLALGQARAEMIRTAGAKAAAARDVKSRTRDEQL